MNKKSSDKTHKKQPKRNTNSLDVRSIPTPEQMQQIQETHLANMEDFPIVSPILFEALSLTEAQKLEMLENQKELEPEFEKTLEDFVNGQLFLVSGMYGEFEKLEVKDVDGMMKGMSAVEQILADDPEYQKVLAEVQSKGKQFATRFKTRMFDVLTDEQWTRLQKLIDDPPEHVKTVRKKFNKEIKSENDGDKEWTPDPDPWKPGDGVPKQYRQK